MKVLVFIFIVVGISHTTLALEKKKCFITKYYEVHVINDLPSNTRAPNSSLPLRLHCASGDDDLGYHNLPTHGDYHWGFCDNYWETTLFFCHLWWGNTIQRAFDVFNFDTKQYCNLTCNWIAKHDAIYFSGHRDPRQGLVKKYYWEATE